MKRRPANNTGAKKSFTHNAMKTHVKNLPATAMRGGIRL